MNAPLYTLEILRLAASLPDPQSLDRSDGSARERSPTCGSTITTDVRLGTDGRVEAISQQVSACAFGQASAALVAREAVGKSGTEIAASASALDDWLGGRRDDPGHWPGLDALAPARSRKSRHGAILLPFRALIAAIAAAS